MKKTILSLCILAIGLGINLKAQNLSNQLDAIAESNDMVGGSVVVFCENGILEDVSVGKSDYFRNIDMTGDSKYRIASISKTITAIAVMQLEEQGLLDLDDDISDILGYEVYNPGHPSGVITTRMLLSHTSSIVDGDPYGPFLGATVNNNTIPNLSEILTPGGAYYDTDIFNSAVPGTYFRYSNLNYVILGTIVEKVANERFDIYCRQHISEPLGIDASFNVNDLTDIDQLATIYRKSNGAWHPQVDNYQGTQPVFNNLNNYVVGTNGGRFGPQGGFRCSSKDLATIFLTLMNDGTYNNVTLLSPETCEKMFANEWTYNGNNGNDYYGLFKSWGLGVHRITSIPGNDVALPGSELMLGHAGEAYGLVSDAYFDKERKVGFVFLTNGVGAGYQSNDFSIFYTVEQEVFEAIENYGNISDCLLPTAVQDEEEALERLFPNPGTDLINIGVCESNEGCPVRVFALDGRLVKSVLQETGDTTIQIQDLNSGMYILERSGKRYSFVKGGN